MIQLRYVGRGWEHAPGKRGRWYCRCLCCTLGRPWRLVIRCDLPLVALLICVFPVVHSTSFYQVLSKVNRPSTHTHGFNGHLYV